MTESNFSRLLQQIRGCDFCKDNLSLPPKPVIQAHPKARVLIIAQAPGIRARASGKPFHDPSGDRLRNWLSVDRDSFYDQTKFALVAMGLCYPGKTNTGDLPPCKECAPIWHPRVIPHLNAIKLTLLVGTYAHRYYLDNASVTNTVKNFRQYLPELLPIPHPSWHNNAWLNKNSWFNTELLPTLKRLVRQALADT